MITVQLEDCQFETEEMKEYLCTSPELFKYIGRPILDNGDKLAGALTKFDPARCSVDIKLLKPVPENNEFILSFHKSDWGFVVKILFKKMERDFLKLLDEIAKNPNRSAIGYHDEFLKSLDSFDKPIPPKVFGYIMALLSKVPDENAHFIHHMGDALMEKVLIQQGFQHGVDAWKKILKYYS